MVPLLRIGDGAIGQRRRVGGGAVCLVGALEGGRGLQHRLHVRFRVGQIHVVVADLDAILADVYAHDLGAEAVLDVGVALVAGVGVVVVHVVVVKARGVFELLDFAIVALDVLVVLAADGHGRHRVLVHALTLVAEQDHQLLAPVDVLVEVARDHRARVGVGDKTVRRRLLVRALEIFRRVDPGAIDLARVGTHAIDVAVHVESLGLVVAVHLEVLHAASGLYLVVVPGTGLLPGVGI